MVEEGLWCNYKKVSCLCMDKINTKNWKPNRAQYKNGILFRLTISKVSTFIFQSSDNKSRTKKSLWKSTGNYKKKKKKNLMKTMSSVWLGFICLIKFLMIVWVVAWQTTSYRRIFSTLCWNFNRRQYKNKKNCISIYWIHSSFLLCIWNVILVLVTMGERSLENVSQGF